jgi:aspartyl-tRNA(Asn)/glutamyl-tRNA(Gln) amidotransferase subunit A
VTDETLAALAAKIRAREISPVEATEACLARIEKLDPGLHAFIELDAEGALRTARIREAEVKGGRARGPLHGVPLAHKDLFVWGGRAASCGTAVPAYFRAEREATAVARLEAAGAITLGRLNLSELALGPFGDNAHHGHVETPWRPAHCAGGSSSGSGAAVAAGFAYGALGTDTGGSIRLPAACCGIVGLKPTYGRVSRAGAMPLSWSLDHVGPLGRTVRDAAILLGVIAGADPADATASSRPVPDYVAGLDRSIAGLRVGVPDRYYWEDLDAEVLTTVRAAIDGLRGLGATVIECALPDPALLNDIANVIARAESAAVHARIARETPHALQPAVRTRLEVGFHVSAQDYLQATRLRARAVRTFTDEVFGKVDVVAAPTIPERAPALARVTAGSPEEIVRRMGRFSRLTRPWNALGLPTLSVPCGFSADGRPVGLQLAGRPFDEATVLHVGHAYEQATDWHLRRPPPAAGHPQRGAAETDLCPGTVRFKRRVVSPSSGTYRVRGCEEPFADDRLRSTVRRVGWADLIRASAVATRAASGGSGRQDPQRRQARRPPRRAAHKVRADPQPQDREGPRSHHPTRGARAGGRSDPVTERAVASRQ